MTENAPEQGTASLSLVDHADTLSLVAEQLRADHPGWSTLADELSVAASRLRAGTP